MGKFLFCEKIENGEKMKIWKEIENGEKLKIEKKMKFGKKLEGIFSYCAFFFPMYSKKRLLLSKKKC